MSTLNRRIGIFAPVKIGNDMQAGRKGQQLKRQNDFRQAEAAKLGKRRETEGIS
jgi:hypothetical protein